MLQIYKKKMYMFMIDNSKFKTKGYKQTQIL